MENKVKQDRFNLGMYRQTFNDIEVTFYVHDVRQYEPGQRHLATIFRKTYISSRWVSVIPDGTKYKNFRVRVRNFDYDEALDRAIKKVEDLLQQK